MSNSKSITAWRAGYGALLGLLIYRTWQAGSDKSTLEWKVRQLEEEKTQLELTIRGLEDKLQRSERER